MKTFRLFAILGFITATFFAQTKKSSATLRLESYDRNGCEVTIPDNPEWNVTYDLFNLQGDLAPNVRFTRRDPSSVLKVDGKYYVWYSYSLTNAPGKTAPWDFNDIYYATSTDGITWDEKGMAVGRGAAGSFDFRSVFTTEVFYHEGMFYLIYQAAANRDGVFGRNTIAMAEATSPDGPWTKLENPILSPTISNTPVFDSNAVHDPCLLFFKDKFYLYYKGEGNERNVCGLGVWNLDKQVKWGVAVSDNPTGPFVKSEYNPITNTGHEVCVWKSGEGIGIMLHQDGPEFATLQYASDGINFEVMGEVEEFIRLQPWNTDYPEAAGLYRHIGEEKSPVSGVSWGISHVLTREQGAFWMYLQRFENTDKSVIVDDADIQGIQLNELSTRSFEKDAKFDIYPNPVTDTLYVNNLSNQNVEIVTLTGQIVYKQTNTTSNILDLSDLSSGFYILKLSTLDNTAPVYRSFIKN